MSSTLLSDADMATKVKRSVEEYKDKNDNPEMFVRRMEQDKSILLQLLHTKSMGC